MVTYKEIISAVVSMDNSAETEARYGISCEAHVQSNKVNSIQIGRAKSGEIPVANFDTVDGNLNIYFFPQSHEERTSVLEAISSFVEDVKLYVNEHPINQ